MAEQWRPLEGDAGIFSQYARSICPDASLEFSDVFDFDDLGKMTDLKAVVLIYPLSIAVNLPSNEIDAYFIKQDIDNACGTIALLHILTNLKLFSGSRELNEYATIHESFAALGETEIDNDTELHFIAIVSMSGRAVWLDGRRDGPTSLGSFKEKGESFGEYVSTLIPQIIDLSSTSFISALAFRSKQE